MNKITSRALALMLCISTLVSMTSCYEDDDPIVDPTPSSITLKCFKPDYLKAGDKVALISPSYYTPMENVEKTAEVLRSWGLEPVVGPNVGKIEVGRYAGTIAERVSDIRWALSDPSIKAIICNRGGYGTIQLIDQLTLKELAEQPAIFHAHTVLVHNEEIRRFYMQALSGVFLAPVRVLARRVVRRLPQPLPPTD